MVVDRSVPRPLGGDQLRSCWLFAAAVLGGRPADPFFEGGAEGEGVGVGEGVGDGLDFVGSLFEEGGGAAHSQVGDLVHGAAAEVTVAKPAELFVAAMGEVAKFLDGPGFAKIAIDGLPKFGEGIVDMPGLGEALDVALDEFDPMLDGDGIFGGAHFVVESLDGAAQGKAVEVGEDRGTGGGDALLVVGMGVADPAEFPVLGRDAMEGVQDMGRGQAGGTAAAGAPFAVDEDAAFAAEAGEEVRAAEVGADHAVRFGGVGNADVADVIPAEGRAVVGANDGFAGVGTDVVGFA